MDFDSPATLNRLRKRATTPKSPLVSTNYKSSPSASPTPTKRPVKNAFEVLTKAAKVKSDRPKQKLQKSEFVENEAQESDDDEMLGFGTGRKDDEDEEDGEDLDKTLETLVDDRDMDEETVAAQLVMEKFK